MQSGFGQSFDVEAEKVSSVSELEIKSFSGCTDKKGYRAVYYFHANEQAYKSEHYFKRKLLSVHEYYFNENGLLTRNVETYSINEENRTNTTHYRYELNEQSQILKKATVFGPNLITTEYYMDYNAIGKPEKIRTKTSSQKEWTQILTYDSQGRVIKLENLESDTLIINELREYNVDDDLVYSIMPQLEGKENDSLAIWIGGDRLAAEEFYEYTYDELNRWTEKYVIVNNHRILLETRKYKLKS